MLSLEGGEPNQECQMVVRSLFLINLGENNKMDISLEQDVVNILTVQIASYFRKITAYNGIFL